MLLVQKTDPNSSTCEEKPVLMILFCVDITSKIPDVQSKILFHFSEVIYSLASNTTHTIYTLLSVFDKNVRVIVPCCNIHESPFEIFGGLLEVISPPAEENSFRNLYLATDLHLEIALGLKEQIRQWHPNSTHEILVFVVTTGSDELTDEIGDKIYTFNEPTSVRQKIIRSIRSNAQLLEKNNIQLRFVLSHSLAETVESELNIGKQFYYTG